MSSKKSKHISNVNEVNEVDEKTKLIFVCNDSKRWVQPFLDASKARGHIVEVVDVNALPKKLLSKGDVLVNFLNPCQSYLNDSKLLQQAGARGFVIANGSPQALFLDGGKCRQYKELQKFGIDVPKTFQISDTKYLAEKAPACYNVVGRNVPVVVKPNLGTEGKNVSVHPTAYDALQHVQKKGSTYPYLLMALCCCKKM